MEQNAGLRLYPAHGRSFIMVGCQLAFHRPEHIHLNVLAANFLKTASPYIYSRGV